MNASPRGRARTSDAAFQLTEPGRTLLQARIARFGRLVALVSLCFYPLGVISRGMVGAIGSPGLASAFGPASTWHVEVCGHHLHTAPEPPSARAPRPVPPDLEAILLRCLAKSRTDRPGSASELREQLLACRAAHDFTQERAARWWAERGRHLVRAARKALLGRPTHRRRCS